MLAGTAWLAMAVLCGPGDVLAAAATVIVHPPDMAALTGAGAIDVLGWNGSGAALPVTVKGPAEPRDYPAGTGAFKVQVKLSPGENSITYGGTTLRVYLAAPKEKAPPAFSAPDPHATDNGCEDCHAFKDGAAALQEPAPGLCRRCHDDMLKDKAGKPLAVPHPPAADGDCLSCHVFHRRSIKHLPAEAKRALCFGCHDDFTGGGKKRMHAPVAAGDCTGCHGAHGGAVKALLPATDVKLCLLCHADPSKKKKGGAWAVAHPALDDGCASCHMPHVSDNAKLLKKPQAQVCADCHDPFPRQEDGKDLVVHSPVDEGDCSSCHGVHGADVKKLLVADGKALCVKCHDDPSQGPGGAAWAVPHPALDDGCLSCHRPHVAPAAGMLKKAQGSLCIDCHDPFPPPAAGGSMHGPVMEGRCSGCHGPHGAPVAKLLAAAPEKALCLKCHKDPSLDGDGVAWAVPHPGLDDGCPACHRPHVAPGPRLLAKPEAELCAGCHENKNVNADGNEWEAPHSPVKSGLCGACHGPHGAPQKALLQLPATLLCMVQCHSEEVHGRHRSTKLDPETNQPASKLATLPADFPVEAADDDVFVLGCLGCHKPHGSDNGFMLPESEQLFCAKCHQF
ncbi:MAG TPA: cytochrome c3 family protein [bacterium]